MCKSMEIMRNESEIKGSIKASLETAKSFNIPDEKIEEYLVAYLLENFDCLSEDEAKKRISEYED